MCRCPSQRHTFFEPGSKLPMRSLPRRLWLAALIPASLFSAACSESVAPAGRSAAAPAGAASGPNDSPSIPAPPISAGAACPPQVRPQFIDVAREAGIDFLFFMDAVPDRFFLPEIMGGGAAWLDYDGDGRLDLYVRDGCRIAAPATTPGEHVSRLFRNSGGGRFCDVSSAKIGRAHV